MNSIVAALRFFFAHTLGRPDLARKLVRTEHARKIPVTNRFRPSRHEGRIRDRGDRPAPAIANAVFDATGQRLPSLPLLLDQRLMNGEV